MFKLLFTTLFTLLLSACSVEQGSDIEIKKENNEAIQNSSSNSDSGLLDSDNDGIPDHVDAFPLDPNEILDSDGDGIGNNQDPDDDNDGVLDAMDLSPFDPHAGTVDPVLMGEADSDGDGVIDSLDAFPSDKSEILDTDGDGIGNNADDDDDGDGILDKNDMTPFIFNPRDTMSNEAEKNDELAAAVKLWQDFTCSACHGAQGEGRIPVLASLNKADLADIITRTMPVGSVDTCIGECAESIANWMKAGFQYPIVGTVEPAEPAEPASYNTNIAPDGTVSQSSVAFDGFPENLIDGNTNNFNHTTSENHPWWQIDLGHSQFVDRIVVISRSGFDDRISDIHVIVSNSPITAITLEEAQEDRSATIFNTGSVDGSTSIDIKSSARFIRLIGYRQYLNFSEFELYGGTIITPVDLSESDDNSEYCLDESAAKARSLRLLTNKEYQNTINDIFEIDDLNNVANVFPNDTNTGGYDNNSEAEIINEARINGYWFAAEIIASTVVNKGLTTFTQCKEVNEDCVKSLINSLGLTLFRRPITNDEKQDYGLLINSHITFDGIAKNIIKAMLMSNNFLYRQELGSVINGRYQLDSFEAASLLSYTFLATTPDSQLIEAALNGQLQTQEQLREQAERLLKLPLAQQNIIHFAKQWLQTEDIESVSKNLELFPSYSQEVATAMNTEFELFSTDTFLGEGKRLSDLFFSDYIFANSALAEFYGLSTSSNGFDRVNAGSQRGGIFKMGAVLASHAGPDSTSPILRGLFVRDRLMCQELPQPPENADLTSPSLDFSKPTRERFAAHTESASCNSCHQYIDSIGYSFESFDASGKFRNTEAGKIIDTSGSILGLASLADTEAHGFSDLDDLTHIIARSTNTAACFVDHFERFSSGVDKGESCTTEKTTSRWAEKNYDFKQLWLELVSSKLYLIRR